MTDDTLPVPLTDAQIAEHAIAVGIAPAIADPGVESGQMLCRFARANMAALQEQLLMIRAQQKDDYKRAESAEAELSRLRAQEPVAWLVVDPPNASWATVDKEDTEMWPDNQVLPLIYVAPPAPSQGEKT